MVNILTDNSYHNKEPYPKIRVDGKNLYYAEILMDDYAGIISEFSAINQYVYHSIDKDEEYRELSKMWLRIAFVEMHHLDMIGKIITLLGGNPIYRGSYSTKGNYWNGGNVYYGKDICQQLRVDLESEYQAIDNYNLHISMIDDKYIKEILKRIILDEKVHIKHFKEAIEKYC